MNLILFAAQLLAALLDAAAAAFELVLLSKRSRHSRTAKTTTGKVSRDTREAQ